jgi:hypothetical protein
MSCIDWGLNLYKSGGYTRNLFYGVVVAFGVVLSALVMVWRFRPRTLLSPIQPIGRNLLSPF